MVLIARILKDIDVLNEIVEDNEEQDLINT